MRQEKYNGWTNYETWAVKLWLDNSEGDQSYWSEAAQEAYDTAVAGGLVNSFTREENATSELRDKLKEEIGEPDADIVPLPESGLYRDLLNGALSEVNWQEIAEAYMSEVEKEESEAVAE